MSENVVPLVRTPVDMPAYARALARAWRETIGDFSTKGQAGVLWAQYGIETGGPPKAACWNNNIGNVKHVPGDGFDFIMLPNTWEIVNGKKQVFQPPDRATWFRAYPSLDDAMRQHFAFLRGTRYAPAWEGVELESCDLFARRLKAAGYFTADAGAYAAGMRAHFKRWMESDAFDKALEELRAELTSETPVVDQPILHVSPPWPEREPPDV